jgi:HEAT repeats
MIRSLRILAITIALAAGINAVPITPLDLVQLTRDSNLIIVGQVDSLREERRGNFDIRGQMLPGRLMVGTLRINRVIKGRAAGNIVFKFLLPDQFVGYRSVPTNQTGMFFFKQTQEGIAFTSSFHPYVYAISDGVVAKSDELGRVMAEISRVIFSSSADAYHRAVLLSHLEGMRTNRSTAVLKKASQELIYPLNALAASYLLQRNEISAISLVEKSLNESPVLLIQGAKSGMTVYLGGSLDEITDPKANPFLVRLAASSHPETRASAIHALGNIKSKNSIPALANALSDSDLTVRWQAVMGLSKILDLNYPDKESFAANEKKYSAYLLQQIK